MKYVTIRSVLLLVLMANCSASLQAMEFNEKLEYVCNYCGSITSKKCVGCKINAHYCNRNCQRSDWRTHKGEHSNPNRVFWQKIGEGYKGWVSYKAKNANLTYSFNASSGELKIEMLTASKKRCGFGTKMVIYFFKIAQLGKGLVKKISLEADEGDEEIESTLGFWGKMGFLEDKSVKQENLGLVPMYLPLEKLDLQISLLQMKLKNYKKRN